MYHFVTDNILLTEIIKKDTWDALGNFEA
jgi:hypothetical protein